MNQQQQQIQEMKNEDRRYGDNRRQKKSLIQQTSVKNPKNLARYNMEELLEMEESGLDD